MQYIEFMSVTFLTNVPKELPPAEVDEELVANQLLDALEDRLRRSAFAADAAIVGYDVERGCLLTTIFWGLTFAGAVKFLKDYPAVKKGVLEIARDVNGLVVMLTKRGQRDSSCVYREDAVEAPELERRTRDDAFPKLPANRRRVHRQPISVHRGNG